MANYRKIWEDANGPIPKDELGRSYEIHHIDGNRENNDLSNLMCVSIEDHIKIHKNQGDFGAVHFISKRLNLSEEQLNSIIYRKINQYSLKGEYIKTWNGALEIQKQLGIMSTNITMVCRGYKNRKSAGGFMWKYEDEDQDKKIIPYSNYSHIGKSVDQLDLKGNYIRTWQNAKIAGLELEIVPTDITSVCKKRKYRKTAGGFIWRYTTN
jgi:hypothetical protein